jgi:hypothetical protein
MSPAEWLADLGLAAEELGYGITELRPSRVELVAKQSDVTITVESVFLSGDWLRKHLVSIPHRSGTGYSRSYSDVLRTGR